MLQAGKDSESVKRENKQNEMRRSLHETRADLVVERTKNPPSLYRGLIPLVHEDLTLIQMQKAYERKKTDLFWENQRRFLEFIDFNSPYMGFEKAKPGYKLGHAWFLFNNPEYADKFEKIGPEELNGFRENNWRTYNELCRQMNEVAPVYASLEGILIPIK